MSKEEEARNKKQGKKKHKIQRELLVDSIQQSYDTMKNNVVDLVEWKESNEEAMKQFQSFKSWKENITKIFWIISTTMLGLLAKTIYEFIISVRHH